MTAVATIGYEGDTIAIFLKRLKKARIRALIDIRELPLSRKLGFSKNALAHNVAAVGIEYFSFRELGSPSHLRKKMRKDKDYGYFLREYRKYARTQKAALREVLAIVTKKRSALLCFEKSAEHCHRKVAAEELQKLSRRKLTVKNL